MTLLLFGNMIQISLNVFFLQIWGYVSARLKKFEKKKYGHGKNSKT